MVSGITCGTTTVASGTLANGMLGFIDTSSGLLFKLSITDLAQLFLLVNLPEVVVLSYSLSIVSLSPFTKASRNFGNSCNPTLY